MKKLASLSIALCISSFLFGQSKRDHLWIIGNKSPNPPHDLYGGAFMKFDNDTFLFEKFIMPSGTPHAVANDENGKLLFYYNFCKVYNKNLQVMEGGNEMNPGSWSFSNDCKNYNDDDAHRSSSIILPFPDSNDRYCLMHISWLKATNMPFSGLAIFDRLQFSEIDLSQNNGLGKVIHPNEIVVSDSLHDAIATVRHGNGRDWWIIVPRGIKRQFWQLLLTPVGLSEPKMQTLPDGPKPQVFQKPDSTHEYYYESWGGQARFSPDGKKYVRWLRDTGIEVYDFDRCTGEMTIRKWLPMPPTVDSVANEGHVVAGGVCFSPNSRFLYYNSENHLMQYDFESTDPNEKPILIEVLHYDPLALPYQHNSKFFLMRNAPDGKIYMNCPNGTFYFHFIAKPNDKGTDCQFKIHGLKLPRATPWIWSDFPNFNLGKMANSSCDTLTVKVEEFEKKENPLTLVPNPATDLIEVIFLDTVAEKWQGHIYRLDGQLHKSFEISVGEKTRILNSRDWPAGPYLITLTAPNETILMKKLIVAH